MSEENENLDGEILDNTDIEEETKLDATEEQEEPEYDAGLPESDEASEAKPEKGIENAGIRRRIERDKRKASAEKDAMLQELLESQRTLAEQVRKLSSPSDEDDTPEIDHAQKNFAKSIMKEAIAEFVQDGERSKEEMEERDRHPLDA